MNVISLTAKPSPFIRNCVDTYGRACAELESVLVPLFGLGVRVWIGLIFFKSGLQKINDWESTLFLFNEEYKLPVISPNLASVLATTFELAMPVLLVLGLATRLSALPLMVMAAVIQFVLGSANSAYLNVEHYYWMFMLGYLVTFGPGKISMDYAIKRMFMDDASRH
ncbi:MAG: DoxX family protein [Rhodospirillaceae bacterium]|nr:DoxX family protein [Rhodospirillaceae bacterium]